MASQFHLDDLIIHVNNDVQSNTYRLQDYISAEGRTSVIRVASDYNYDALRRAIRTDQRTPRSDTLYSQRYDPVKFRTELFADLRIPRGTKLRSPENLTINVENRTTFIIALTQIQGSDHIRLARTADNERVWVLTSVDPDEDNPSPRPPIRRRRPRNVNNTVRDGNESSSKSEDDSKEKNENDHRNGNRRRNDRIVQDTRHNFTEVNINDWAQVCRLFSCPSDATSIRVAGINGDIEPYQAYAIWRALHQITTGNASFMIADDVGLGKTMMAISIFTIYHIMQQVNKEVSEEQEGIPEDQAERKHLPYQASQENNSVCPTQSGRIQCSCVKTSLAYRLLEDIGLADFPTLVVVPPGLLPHWYSETQKWIDKSPGSPASSIVVRVAHSAWKTHNAYLTDNMYSELEAKKTVLHANEVSVDLYRQASQNIILVSQHGTSHFLDRFKISPENMRNTSAYNFCAAFVFFDEFHNYSGAASGSSGTAPFRMLEAISVGETNFTMPTIAIGLSSSARSDIGHWIPFVRHAFQISQHSRGFLNGDLVIAEMRNVTDMQEYQRIWKRLVDDFKHQNPQGEVRDRAHNPGRDKLYNFLRRFLPVMMVSRQRGDKFRDKDILVAPDAIRVIECSMQAGATLTIFRNYVSNVRSWVNRAYQLAVAEWDENDQEGQKPERRRIAHTRLYHAVDARSMRRSGSVEFHVISKASTFPAVARLIEEGEVQYEATLSRRIGTIVVRFSRLIIAGKPSPENTVTITSALERSPWWQYRNGLARDSPKYQEVRAQINDLLTIASLPVDDASPVVQNAGPPPPDGSNKRHALVFCDSPLSSFLMFMLLFDQYRDANIALMYVDGGTDVRRREGFRNYKQADCEEDDPVKILISTMDIMGQGYDLSRANTVILTELPRTSERQNQAFGRVNRRGQLMLTRLIQLFDNENISERVREVRNRNTDQLAEVVHTDNTNTSPLADLILDQDENDENDDNNSS
ncbi:hypothetical protein F4678DRAFT_477838 [Xylaria arbuscula]|nr:hypothetical protein F4678DRAFT_477838 [Xylaria arbuscula]